MTKKTTSRILEEMHETAKELKDAGFITKRRMIEYNALCLEPLPTYSSEKIQAIRKQCNISQTVMASVFNISPSTIRSWEGGAKHPSGPSLKLLNILERKGLEGLI